MLGPQQQRLAAYVANADPEPLHGASTQWAQAESLLRRLSTQLDAKAKEFGHSEEFSGSTATAASTAFSSSAKKMSDRADQMHDGSEAFRRAANAIHTAKQANSQFAEHAGAQPPKQPADLTDVQAQKDWKTSNNQFWNHYDKSETAAGDAITALTQNHTEQAAVFAKIHGEPPPPPPPPPPGPNPVNAGTPPTTTTHVPVGTPVDHHNDWDPGNHDHDDTNDTNDTTDDTTDETTDDPTVDDPTADPGIPQGPDPTQGSPFPTGGGVPGGVGTVGGGAGAVGGVGAVAGGALGGAAAAGLAAGGLNGGLNGLVAGGGVRGGLSSSGVRGIGSTSRTGVGSVLGRGTGAGARGAGARGAGARGAGAGGTAGRNGRGGSRGAGGRGTTGRAGSRGAGAGAGAGRGGGKDKKRQGEERDLFDDGADWIDDEDVAPGVLD
ncbi:hypothetical protein [Nocardioides halotolerans]|uniref:hypothetical protein n=1 Tax=Nocardioides halotolerans TaxID=433660 RepID=UPI0004188C69|nr:hypothetical protein [Nocardioides halotolerans]